MVGGGAPHPAGLGLVLHLAPAPVQAVGQQRETHGIALLGGFVVVVGRHAPVPGAGRFPPGFYFFVSRLLRVVARVEQAVEQGLIQCGRVAPRVDDHAVDVRRIQHQFHGVLQGVVRHGAGRRAAVHAGSCAGGEQRQPGTVLVFQGPERKPSGLLLRDGVLGSSA